MQTIKPASKHLFCRPIEVKRETKSGILLSSKAVERPQIAEVINVGSGVTEYKSKDQIIYKPYTTTEIKLDGKDYFLLEEQDALGIVLKTND